MEKESKNSAKNDAKSKLSWLRPNLFDAIFIICAIIVAGLIVTLSNRSGGNIFIPGSKEIITYTIELQSMYYDTAYMIKPGDELIDKIEKRPLGNVVSVEVMQSKSTTRNFYTGERFLGDFIDRLDAVVVVSAEATVTDSKISIGGFDVRIGTWVSVNGPLYNSNGFIIDMERIGEEA